MEVRRATIGDAAAVTDLYRQSAAHHVALDPAFYHLPDRDAVADYFTEQLGQGDQPADTILVAEIDGVVVGVAEVHVREPPAAHSMIAPQRLAMASIVVDEAHRGRGIGSQLMSHLEAWAFDHGADLVMLDVLGANAAARSLYQSLGYLDHGVLLLKRKPAD